MPRIPVLTALLFCLFTLPSMAQESLTVQTLTLKDEKAVFATVESVKEVAARSRLSGTVIEIGVREGDLVKAGQVIARVVDEKLALQIRSMDSRIAAPEGPVRQGGR